MLSEFQHQAQKHSVGIWDIRRLRKKQNRNSKNSSSPNILPSSQKIPIINNFSTSENSSEYSNEELNEDIISDDIAEESEEVIKKLNCEWNKNLNELFPRVDSVEHFDLKLYIAGTTTNQSHGINSIAPNSNVVITNTLNNNNIENNTNTTNTNDNNIAEVEVKEKSTIPTINMLSSRKRAQSMYSSTRPTSAAPKIIT